MLFVPPIVSKALAYPSKIAESWTKRAEAEQEAEFLIKFDPLHTPASTFTGSEFLVAPGTALPIDNAPYTIEMWLKPEHGRDHMVPLYWGQVETKGHCNGIDIRVKEGKVHHFWWGQDCSADFTYDEGKWVHIALTWDTNQRSVYVNGALKKSDFPGRNYHTASDLFISCDRWDGMAAYKGEIADIRIWNTALPSAEFSGQLDTISPPDSLVRWYRFGADVTEGAILKDLSRHKADAKAKCKHSLSIPQLTLVEKGSPRQCVFENASELQNGGAHQLTLLSPGKDLAVVPKYEEPKNFKNYCEYIELGIGRRPDAIVASYDKDDKGNGTWIAREVILQHVHNHQLYINTLSHVDHSPTWICDL